MKKLAIIAFFVCTTISAFSQNTVKLGHTNVQDILMLLPERADAEKKVQDLSQTLQTRLQTMTDDYQKKVSDFQANESTMTDAIRQSSYEEIQDLQKRIQQFQQSAQTEVQNKENSLLQPMVDKIQAAIDSVGKMNGYTYIFDTSSGALIYKGGTDVTPMVKKQLGL